MSPQPVSMLLDSCLVVLTAEPPTTLAAALDLPTGCGEGICGSCTVLLDDEPVRACLILAVQAEGCGVDTVRSLPRIEGEPADSEGLTPLQRHLRLRQAFQCGWCIPGLLVGTARALRGCSRVERSELLAHLSGHLCRCLSSAGVMDAIEDALRERRGTLA